MVRISAFMLLLAPLLAPAASLSIHGSNTVGAELAPALVRAWLEAEGYRIDRAEVSDVLEVRLSAAKGAENLNIGLASHGSSTGFRDVLAGQADVAMSSRPIRDSEAEALVDSGGFHPVKNEFVVALDGIAVIVHPDNPLAMVSKEKLAEIFSGRGTQWSDYGWPSGGSIRIYARDDASGTFDTFSSLVMDGKPLVASARRYESNDQLSDDVSADRQAIGFVALPAIRAAKPVAVHEAGTRPLMPSVFTVATEDYSLARRLYFYVPEARLSPLVQSFISFTMSNRGQDVVRSLGFVSQNLDAVAVDPPESAPDEYVSLVSGASRLSVNIRFRPGATSLDSKALHDLDRIAEYLKQPENRNDRVMLMGFTDAQEAAPAFADQLATVRADYIASQLKRRGVPPTRVRGFGQDLPVASNATTHGRQKNRRVEVWIYDDREFRPPMGGIASS